MRKKLLMQRAEQARWIRLAVLLVISAGLITACIWMQRNLPPGQSSTINGAPRIKTATATAVLAAELGKDQTPLPPSLPEQGDSSSSARVLPADDSMPYMLQLGTPKYLPAFAHPDKGCAWVGFGGQVFDEHGAGRDGLVVFLTGVLDGQPVNLLGITAPQNVFGPGGYEIFLSDRLPEQTRSLEIQLFDVQGRPLSAAVGVALPTDCTQNLVLVNFQSSYQQSTIRLPLVHVQP